MNTVARVLPQKLGKYLVVREVGRGGMGVVYEGHDPIIDRRVALKTLIGDLFSGPESEEFLARLRREAQAAGRLSHPHIVAVYDFGEDVAPGTDGAEVRTAFIAMEFVEGRELGSFFDTNERFPIPEIKRIMSELLDALEYSHSRGVVHRDIKPANIILLANGSVKVADFGIARIESSTLTQVGTVLGSPSYMSPEQFLGQTVDGRSDLYSAAIVLYQLLTGEVPFSGSFSSVMHRVLNNSPVPPSALNLQAPKGFDALLQFAMGKRPDERFQTAAAFKNALLSTEATFGGDDATAVRLPGGASSAPTPRAGGGARRWVLPVAAACLAGIAAAAYVFLGPSLHRSAASTDTSPPTATAPGTVATAQTAAPAMPSTGASATGTAAGRQSALPVPDAVTPPAPAAMAAAPLRPASVGPAGTAVISAVGLADPKDPSVGQTAGSLENRVWADARRQLIAKAAALYIVPKSIDTNYAVLRTKLLSHSDDYISTVLDSPPPQVSQYGLMVGTMRATVKVRDVQKALNKISSEDRIDLVRNNAFPKISVSITSQEASDDPSGPPQRSAVAENILKERIRSFGFPIVDDQSSKATADFAVDGEVRFKKLSARLAASGLTITKFVLTSWTIRAVDSQSGEEIYHDTTIPEKMSWASEELALKDIGRLIGEKFSKTFFLQYFDFGAQRVRLRFSGLPATAAVAMLPEIDVSLQVLNAAAVEQQGTDAVIDADLSGGASVGPGDLVQEALLASLNRKLGRTCFTVANASATEVHVLFDSACNTDATLKKLESLPPEGLVHAPARRIEDVVKDPNALQRTTI